MMNHTYFACCSVSCGDCNAYHHVVFERTGWTHYNSVWHGSCRFHTTPYALCIWLWSQTSQSEISLRKFTRIIIDKRCTNRMEERWDPKVIVIVSWTYIFPPCFSKKGSTKILVLCAFIICIEKFSAWLEFFHTVCLWTQGSIAKALVRSI